MNPWVAIYRFGWIALVILGLIGLICVFLPKYSTLRAMRTQKIEKEEETRRLEARIAELRSHQEKFLTDPAFVERTAREMGMVKPNETIFKTTNRNSRVHSP
jgi:cell division protein FtsB